jgi:hypothetical protein
MHRHDHRLALADQLPDFLNDTFVNTVDDDAQGNRVNECVTNV